MNKVGYKVLCTKCRKTLTGHKSQKCRPCRANAKCSKCCEPFEAVKSKEVDCVKCRRKWRTR